MNNFQIIFYKGLMHIALYVILLFSSSIFSQAVGVNAATSLGIFHVDGKGDNHTTTIPTPRQQLNDFIITKDGNIGIGLINPNSKLHISSNSDPLKLEGLTEDSYAVNKILLIDDNNVIKKGNFSKLPNFPHSAFFYLENNISNFLNNSRLNTTEAIPMKIEYSNIEGLLYNAQKSTITFPKGIYEITLNFEATHKGKCNTTSYFANLPYKNASTIIHRTLSHLGTTELPHNGTITFVTELPNGGTWKIGLGKGEAGLCPRSLGVTLNAKSTQLFIYKIID